MLDRADCADFGCHNSIRLETKHFLNTLALTFISFSGRFVFAYFCIIFFFCERSSSCNSPRLARDALALGPSATLNRDPTSATRVNNSSQILLKQSHNISNSTPGGQLQEQGFSVEVAERIAAPQRSSARTIYKSKWALFEKCCRENLVDFSTPSVKQVSDFFMYLYQDLNRCPSTIDGYRPAIVDTLGPSGHHISQSLDLDYSPIFTGIVPKVPGIFQN